MSTVGPREIEQYLAAYSEQAERWKLDHDEAMACVDLEQFLVLGLTLAFSIDMIDTNWRTAMLAGQVEYDPAEEAEIQGRYRSWLAPSADILNRIEGMEAKGYKVRWADEFRRAYRDAVSLFVPDAEFFSGDALVELRDAAIDAQRAGSHEHGE
ncbi:hypothetical protein AB1L88_11635 [Tautonia sp. JC769]|uniref:hypothetical protein n=1 Tax=Tautonia sp. JC769 TaxID=3232135 RepID=UPI00345AA600